MFEQVVVDKYQAKLVEMKDVLEKRLAAIHKDKSKSSGPLNPDFQEQAVDLQNNEVLDEIDNIDHNELALINKALVKIESGSYGACESCEEEISQKRLDALPFADKCIKCSS
jgi:DnaK suppressor protein